MRVPPPLPRREATNDSDTVDERLADDKSTGQKTADESTEEKSTDSERPTPRVSDIRDILDTALHSEPDTIQSPTSEIDASMPAPDRLGSRGRALLSFGVALAIVGVLAGLAAVNSGHTRKTKLDGLLANLPLLPSSLIQNGLREAPFVVVPMGPPSEAAGAPPSERAPFRRGLPGQARRSPPPPASANAAPSAGPAANASGLFQPEAP